MTHMQKTSITYISGFVLSLLLTCVAFGLVMIFDKQVIKTLLIAILLVIAFIQLTVQLLFFLHLGEEKRPRWNTIFFIGTMVAVLTVVLASIWIMNHLNYNMTPKQVNQYIDNQSTF